MATATKKSPSPSSHPSSTQGPRTASVLDRIVQACEAIYRFLASLKLAVISLATLAATLAYATFFESWYGGSAAQEWIYRTRGFALLLAFLGINILCAALIRFPWKRRQIGFLITHAGLLVLLAGSYWSIKTADEGQVGMVEGDVKHQMVRLDHPKLRIFPIDPDTKKPSADGYELDFRPGNFAWGPGNPIPKTIFGRIGDVFSAPKDPKVELTNPDDPFKLVVKSHLPASMLTLAHEPDPRGVPMARIHPRIKAPGMPRARDVFEFDLQNWFKTDKRLYRAVKSQGPAQFVFLYVDRPELIDDFRNPPKYSGTDGVARFRYRDRSGKARSREWPLDGQAEKSITLPDSDLSATFVGVVEIPVEETGLGRTLGDATIPVAHFRLKRGDGPEADYYGWASLPMVPNLIPNGRPEGPAHKTPLIEITYYLPPDLKSSGRFGVVEVLGTPDTSLYYRVFGRSDTGRSEVRASGPLTLGKEVLAFGGNPNMPMTLTFRVEDFLPSGVEKEVCEPISLPKGKMGEGIPASLVEMTYQGETREFWIRRSPSLEPTYQRVSFPAGDFEISYDVDRKGLGFSLKLDDFDVGFDPGTDRDSSYTSKVRLSDKDMGIRDTPYTITMNEPLTHRGYTFYQTSYQRQQDPGTGRETGQFMSVFQVATDPGRTTKYLGCLMVVLGAFVQFYMRAGVFTDGGKRERERAAARARKTAGRDAPSPETTVSVVTESEDLL